MTLPRRGVFRFLATAPLAVTLGFPEKEEKSIELVLPKMAAPGEIVQIVNTGPNWIIINAEPK